jgi:methyl-accepting chemotaxis protein
MNLNTKNIENLTTISSEVEEKIDITSQAIETSNKVAKESKADNIKMSEHIEEIIEDIAEIELLSTANDRSTENIEEDLEKLVEIATSLQSTINEFKS